MTEIDPNLELIEKYIRGLDWSSDIPDITKTIVVGNIRAFYHWSQEHLVNERGDRLEAMIDRMAETNVDLQAKLAERDVFYGEVASKLNTANFTLSAIKKLISDRESGLTQRTLDGAYWLCKDCGQRNDIDNYKCEACGEPYSREEVKRH